MGNNSTQNSKLDETIKESLNNYEAQYDAGDWSRMERMLDAAPKSYPGSNMSYGKIAIIAGAVILGSFLIYKVAGTSSSTETPEITTAPPEVKPEPAQTTTTPPAVTTNTVISAPPPAATGTATVKPETIPSSTVATPPATQATVAEKVKKDKKKTDEAEYNKNQKISVMGNEPIFGDMIDSSKGIIHETKEKESTRKAAKSKGTGTIGLGSLLNMHINLDSLNKYNESKKDSIH
jgi:hypothetical protein